MAQRGVLTVGAWNAVETRALPEESQGERGTSRAAFRRFPGAYVSWSFPARSQPSA